MQDPITDLKAGVKDEQIMKKYKMSSDDLYTLKKYKYLTTDGGKSEAEALEMYPDMGKYVKPAKEETVDPAPNRKPDKITDPIGAASVNFNRTPAIPEDHTQEDIEGNQMLEEDRKAREVGASLLEGQSRETVAKQMGLPVEKEKPLIAQTYAKNGAPASWAAPVSAYDKEKSANREKNQQEADAFYATSEGKSYYNFVQSVWKPLVESGSNMLAATVRAPGTLAGAFGDKKSKQLYDNMADAIVDKFDFDKTVAQDRADGALIATPTALQGGLYEDGQFHQARFIPATMSTLTNMAVLISGGEVIGGGKAALFASSYLSTVEGYRKDGKAAGLKGEQLDAFSNVAAGFTSTLELVSPNDLIKGVFKKVGIRQAFRDIRNGVTVRQALARGIKETLKEVGQENVQELSQNAADHVTKKAFGVEEHLTYQKIADEVKETVLMTSLATFVLSSPNAARHYKPTTLVISSLNYAGDNLDEFNKIVDKNVAKQKLTAEQGQVFKDNVGKYSNRVKGLRKGGMGEDQAARIAFSMYKDDRITERTKPVTSSPILNAALGPEVKKEQEEVKDEIKDASMGIPELGSEITGDNLSRIVENTENHPKVLVDRVKDKTYRLEEINLKEKYDNEPAFKKAVDEHEKSKADPEGLRMPPIVSLDGKVQDGKKRLVQQYVNGEKTARVFKEMQPPINLSDAEIKNEGYVKYEDAIKLESQTDYTNLAEGDDEGSMEARSQQMRDQEVRPPKFTPHPIGTKAVDRYGEVHELREVPFDQLIAKDEGTQREATTDKYSEWIKAGEKMPPLRGVENYVVEGGKVKITDGAHRVLAAKKAGLTSVPVWVALTDKNKTTRPVYARDEISLKKSNADGKNNTGATQTATPEVQGNTTDVIASRGRDQLETDKSRKAAIEKVQSTKNNKSLDAARGFTKENGLPEYTKHDPVKSDPVKQTPIAENFEKVQDVTDPSYKETAYEKEIFEGYKAKFPKIFEQNDIKNYKDLVEKAYRQLAHESGLQFEKLGVKVEYHSGEKNYENSQEMLDDVHNFKHLWVYDGGQPSALMSEKNKDGITNNNIFRAVHDFYGHSIGGFQFGPTGEENAWLSHSKMFSPLAQWALTTETRGQNSWVNYSGTNTVALEKIKEGSAIKKIGVKEGNAEAEKEGQALIDEGNSEFVYAPQKVAVLPVNDTDASHIGVTQEDTVPESLSTKLQAEVEKHVDESLANGTLPVTNEELGEMVDEHKNENNGTATTESETNTGKQAADQGVHGESNTGTGGGLSEEHVSQDDQKTDDEKAQTERLKAVAEAFSKRFDVPTKVITIEEARKLLEENEDKDFFFQILEQTDLFNSMDPVEAKEFILKVFQTVTTPEDGKKAYRKLANKYHPDKHQTAQAQKAAEDIFKYLNEANERFKDGRISTMPGAQPTNSTSDFNDWMRKAQERRRQQQNNTGQQQRQKTQAEQDAENAANAEARRKKDEADRKQREQEKAAAEQRTKDREEAKVRKEEQQKAFKELREKRKAEAQERRKEGLEAAAQTRTKRKEAAQKAFEDGRAEANRVKDDKLKAAKNSNNNTSKVAQEIYNEFGDTSRVIAAEHAKALNEAEQNYYADYKSIDETYLKDLDNAEKIYRKHYEKAEDTYSKYRFQKTGDSGIPAGFYDPNTGTAYLVDGVADDTTPIHEIFSHPFIAAIEERNPELFKNMLAAAKADPAIKDFVDKHYGDRSQAVRDHEYIARAIDLDAKGKLKNKTLLDHIKEFWRAVTDYVNDVFGGRWVSIENIKPTTPVGDLVDFVLKSGTDLNLSKSAAEAKAKQEAYDEVAGLKPKGIPGRIEVEPFIGGKAKSLSKIILDLSIAGKFKVFFMKSKRRAPGSYSPGSTSIKIQFSGDLDVTAHEIGHALDDRHNIMDKVLASHAAVAELDQFSKFGSKPPSGHPYPKRYVAGEGIAEFIRALVVNPTEAQKVAPELYSIFQSSVPAGDRKVITDFSNDVRVWAGQTHLDRTISQIEWEPEKKDGAIKEIINPKKSNKMLRYTWANRLAANYVNPMNFFNKAFKYAMSEKGVTDVFEKDDPRFLVRLLYSVDGKFGEMFDKGITTVDGVVHIDGNGKAKNYEWLLEPLHNQDEATIKREMQLVTAYMVSERVVELSDRFNREDILSGVGGGIYKDVEAARAALEEITKGDPAQLTRIREAAARYREFAGHVLRYMVDSGRLSEEQYQKIKEDNTHYVAMHRIMEAEPEQEVVAYTSTGGAKLGSTKEVLNKIKGSTKKISNPYVSIIDILHKAVAESDRNNVMSKFTDMIEATRGMNEGAVENLADVGQKGEGANSITVFKNGKPQKWVLHPDIYRALKGIDHDYLKLPAWATWHARTLRAMTTKFPTFAIRNVAKDIQSKLMLSNEGGGISDYVGNAEDWNTLALRGGLNAGFYTKNKATYYGMMKGAMFEMAKDKGNIIANPTRLKKVWHWYEKQLFKSETTTRVAEYRAAFRKAKANGRDDYSASIYAAYKARDLVDFAVAGHHVRVINQVIPFTNAAVQGLRSAILKAKENPAGFLLRTVIFSVLPQMAEWFINHWDDDTAKEYEDMPAYRKDMFYNFKLGKNFWLSVPKPYELALVGAGVKRGLSKYWGHDQRAKDHAFENYGESAFKALSPVDETSIGGPFAGLIENLANYDFFRDKAIVPPYENKPNLALHHTEVASRLGQVLQKAVGVDARKLDHLLQSEFSYVGKFGMDLSDIGDKKSRPHFSAQDFGIFKQSPGYDGAAVQRMLKYADDAALTQDAGYKKFVLLSRKYFAAEGDEAKEKEGKILRVAAELLLDKWERKDVLNKKIKKFQTKQRK